MNMTLLQKVRFVAVLVIALPMFFGAKLFPTGSKIRMWLAVNALWLMYGDTVEIG